jgi:hypothetical protein
MMHDSVSSEAIELNILMYSYVGEFEKLPDKYTRIYV